MQLNNKTIILTGAASGIGQALLTQLAQITSNIIAVDINSEGLEAICDALNSSPAKITPLTLNMMHAEDIDRLFEFALAEFGTIDIFIANAGFAYYERLDTPDWQHIEQIFQLNTITPIYSATKMANINQNRSYKVVITASAMAHWALPGYSLYSSTKSALDSFATAYRTQLSDPNSLMLVYPIATRTDFFERAGENANTVAPTPFPSQTADYVATQILKGVETDQQNLYPSIIFKVAKFLNRFLPIQWLNRQMEKRSFEAWVSKQNQDQSESA